MRVNLLHDEIEYASMVLFHAELGHLKEQQTSSGDVKEHHFDMSCQNFRIYLNENFEISSKIEIIKFIRVFL
jgi:hypothetical protein